jgi:hypothetical protein
MAPKGAVCKIVWGVLSPLLANLYMRRFVLGWKVLGHEQRLDAHIVNYADDPVICCRGSAGEALSALRDMMAKLRLTVNETKTRPCCAPDEPFTFLGYTFGRNYSPKTGASYIGPRPSAKKISTICREISEQTGRQWTWLEPGELVRRLNQKLVGWANYFCLGRVGLSARDGAHGPSAPSVARPEVPRAGSASGTLLGPLPARGTGIGVAPGASAAPPLVGESVRPGPRAGCGRSARPDVPN